MFPNQMFEAANIGKIADKPQTHKTSRQPVAALSRVSNPRKLRSPNSVIQKKWDVEKIRIEIIGKEISFGWKEKGTGKIGDGDSRVVGM